MASQNCWASCWSRRTGTKAVRSPRMRFAHVHRCDVFPLPAGAEMIVTFRAAARSKTAKSSSRSISPGLPELSSVGRSAAPASRGAVGDTSPRRYQPRLGVVNGAGPTLIEDGGQARAAAGLVDQRDRVVGEQGVG